MKKILLAICVLSLTSCTQRGCQSWKRGMQFSERNYEITMFSGGHVVFSDHFHGIINQEEGSDGIYYIKGDSLIEISGDYTIKSVN